MKNIVSQSLFRQTERKRWSPSPQSEPEFTQANSPDRVELGHSGELRLQFSSPTWVAGTQPLELTFAASQECVRRKLMREQSQDLSPGTPVEDEGSHVVASLLQQILGPEV